MTEPNSNRADDSGLSIGEFTPPQTMAELGDILDWLFQKAHADGILTDDTSYVFRHDGNETADWEVEIVLLDKKRDLDK